MYMHREVTLGTNLYLLEARLLQTLLRGVHGMEGRRRSVEELDKVLCSLERSISC